MAEAPAAKAREPQRVSPAAIGGLGQFAYLDDSNNVQDDSAVEVVRERYPNGNVKIERCVTLDADKNYVNQGAWKMLSPAGELIAEGQYEMGKRIGVWTRYHGRNESPSLNEYPYNRFQAPFISQANFVDGVIDGEWLIEDAEKKKCVQISFKMGERHGPAVAWLPNGKMFRQATYDEGKPVGDVLEVNSQNGEFERTATYVDGRKIITKTKFFKGTKTKQSEALYLAATTVKKSPDDFWTLRFAEYTTEGKDLRHGVSKEFYSNGKPYLDGNYQNDLRVGKFTYWHENGQVAVTGEYRDDQPNGLWVWFHDNGLKSAIGKYENGVLIGEWRWWNEDGKLTKLKSYDGTESVTTQPQEVFDLGRLPSDLENSVR
jgi:antitoxin component YwqK of YwqJK toxin-antitoxin module